MKKSLYSLLLLLCSFGFVSCDEDTRQSMVLSGEWYGDFGMYYTYRGVTYDSYDTKIQLLPDYTYATHGYGTQVDFYPYGPYDYIYHQIRWSIVNGVITIHYRWEEEWDTQIFNYSLTNNYFSGRFGDSPERFRLQKLVDYYDWTPYYVDYYGWGYRNGWSGGYPWYAPGKDGAGKEGKTTIEMPQPSEVHFGNRFVDRAKAVQE